MKTLGILMASVAFLGGVTASEAAVAPWSLSNVSPKGYQNLAQNKSRDYSSFYAVDLNAKIPPLEELKQKYLKNTIYDRKYEFAWNIGQKFDPEFNSKIKAYGSSDKRLKKIGEDLIYDMIKTIPEGLYPYIGPYLHTVPNMSQKILEMPGIKETKNKFPERIAPQVKHIENLEFLSPFMYFVLMPEIWPENIKAGEYPRPKPIHVKVEYDEKFWQRVKERVRPEDYYPNRKRKGEGIDDKLRTINPSLETTLTSADVKAFGRTLKDLKQYGQNMEGKLARAQAGLLIDKYEEEQGIALPVKGLKDLVNPCQRLVQRLRVSGQDSDVLKIVGKEGFSLEEWAYTCDKTIKAYRLSRMSLSTLKAIMDYRDNVYKEGIMSVPMIFRGPQLATMLALPEMYKASEADVKAVRKNRRMLEKELKEMGFNILDAPIAVQP